MWHVLDPGPVRYYVSRDNVENGDDAEKASCPQPPTEYCEQAIVSECGNQGLEYIPAI